VLRLEKAVFRQGGFTVSADWTVDAGTVTAVIGPSGAGKSTLLNGIAGFVPQDAGQVAWGGAAFGAAAPNKRPVSMLFQDNNLFPHLTVMQNVALALGARLRPSVAVQSAVEEMLGRVSLAGLSDRKPAALSGGQQSRVALARALLQDRPVLLLDEPFGALGPALKDEMLDLTVELAGQRAVVMITHDPADASRVADAVIGVVGGVAAAPVETGAFMADPPDALRAYFGQPK